METADYFLVFGEKMQELKEAGYDSSFHYHSNTGSFYCTIFSRETECNEKPFYSGDTIKLNSTADLYKEFCRYANILLATVKAAH